jgi:hypothetical protein
MNHGLVMLTFEVRSFSRTPSSSWAALLPNSFIVVCSQLMPLHKQLVDLDNVE